MHSLERLTVVCWQPVLTAHQSETFVALQDCESVTLRAITSRADNLHKPGWVADDPRIPVELLPRRKWRERTNELLSDSDAIHIFATPFDWSRCTLALLSAIRRGRAVFLLSEPYGMAPVGYFADRFPWVEKLKHRLRPALYRFYGALLGRKVAAVFAISPRAVVQYQEIGFPPEHIYPFGYFVSGTAPRTRTASLSAAATAPLRCVFIGSMIERKGIHLALDAFRNSPCLQAQATLDIYGPGQPPSANLPAGVDFRGALPHDQVQEVMAQSDLVLVPSLFDGWGVVVNEAVNAGTPVVASDAVGAAAMLQKWGCGRTFNRGDVGALQQCLEDLAADRSMVEHLRARTAALAQQIQPTVAGRYMYECIHARLCQTTPPIAPWFGEGFDLPR